MKFSDVEKLKKRLQRVPRNFAEGAALTRDAFHMIETFQAEQIQLVNTIDALLAHCEVPECVGCSKAVCPFKDEMHFHHDGCPSCAQAENPPEPPKLIVLPR